jgi:mRNA interferase RelE/StbE
LAWKIEFEQDAIRQLNRLDKSVRRRILKYLELRAAVSGDPRKFGKPLRRDKAASGRIGLQTTESSACWSTSG